MILEGVISEFGGAQTPQPHPVHATDIKRVISQWIVLSEHCCSVSVVVDVRRSSCWVSVIDGRCEGSVHSDITKDQCCASVGVAWGSPCEKCPTAATVHVTDTTFRPTIAPGNSNHFTTFNILITITVRFHMQLENLPDWHSANFLHKILQPQNSDLTQKTTIQLTTLVLVNGCQSSSCLLSA